MIWSDKNCLRIVALTAAFAALSCNKKKASDDATDLTDGGTPLVVSGNQPVTGGAGGGITVNKTDDGIVFSGNDDADTTPPVAGGNGVISVNGFTPSTISISWTAATDNSGSVIYDVYSSTSVSLVTLADVKKTGVTTVKAGSTITNYTLTGLTNGTNYNIVVVAKDALGNAVIYKQVTQTAQQQDTAISAATSIVSVVGGASTLPSGSTAVLQLRARLVRQHADQGGAAVQFTISGGSSTFSQTFPLAATDNGNGTYTANVTGLVAGTAVTIGAKVNGTSSTSTHSLQVVPGVISATTSAVEIVEGVNTVATGGHVTLRLRAKDAAGNFLTTGRLGRDLHESRRHLDLR